ncbi:MAG TPA: diacylglycerol kinase family protein [Ktedonobacteraceae bacterium]|jgi:diacylglycerol kinase
MDKPPTAGELERGEFAKFIAGFGYAFHGLWYALRTQRNARVHLVVAILVTIAGILLHLSALEFAILAITIAGVFIAEMFNTVIEICVDLAQPECHPLAKIAKDVAAGAVLLSAMLAVVVGLFVLGPPLWVRIFL